MASPLTSIPNFKNKIDYQEALRHISKSMVRLKRPERLLKMITRFINKQFGLNHTSLLVLEEKKGKKALASYRPEEVSLHTITI